jgi:DNA primase
VLERGIKIETAKRWGLRYDKRLQRVVFPVRRMDGRLVGCSGRIIPSFDVPNRDGDHPLRYYNYSGLNKMRYLYGAHLFKLGNPVVVTEGQFDALKTSQALGENVNVCATLGHGFTEDHRKTIASCQPDAIYLFQDNDIAGRRAAEMVASKLHSVAPLMLMRPTGGKDPGAMTDEAIQDAFKNPQLVLNGQIDW